MATFPNPITQDNFPKAWRSVRRKYKQAKVKAAIRRIAKPAAEILFFPIFVFLSFGTASTFSTAGIQAFLARTPVLAPLWARVRELLFEAGAPVWENLLRGAALLYALPLAAFLALAAVIALVYHPKSLPQKNDLSQDAPALWTMARHAQADARRKGSDLSGTLALIAGILATLVSLFIIFYWLLFPGGQNMLAGIGVQQVLRLFVLALILIFAYAPLMYPLSLLMRLVCWCPGTRRMADGAEIFCKSLRRGPVPSMEPIAVPTAAPVSEPAPAAEAIPKAGPEEAAPETAPEEAPQTVTE